MARSERLSLLINLLVTANQGLDPATIQKTGLGDLQTWLQNFRNDDPDLQTWRQKLERVIDTLETTIREQEAEQVAQLAKNARELELKQKAQVLLQEGYRKSGQALQTWLSVDHLLSQYHAAASRALQALEFDDWERHDLRPAWEDQRRAVEAWIEKASNFFHLNLPAPLSLVFPEHPQVVLPTAEPAAPTSKDLTPVIVATGVGLLFGGPAGAALLGGASYLLNQGGSSDKPQPFRQVSYEDVVIQGCQNAAEIYLRQFSQRGLVALEHYQSRAARVIDYPLTASMIDRQAESQAQWHRLRTVYEGLQRYWQKLG
ncbi:MAG: hypothetical protein NW237_14540 [Cyanobacteriota bacterium]|nr:hypothetical protein [Cyanobacteriota bacterium]